MDKNRNQWDFISPVFIRPGYLWGVVRYVWGGWLIRGCWLV